MKKKSSILNWVMALSLAMIACLPWVKAATAPAFEWIPLQVPASPDKAMNIIITGDGYTASQKATFLADCQLLVAGFSNKEPWKTYISHINFYGSWVVSNQEGVSILNGTQVDTAFKAVVDTSSQMGELVVDANIFLAYEAVVPVSGYHFFVVNSTAYDNGDTLVGTYAIFFHDPSTNGSNLMVGAGLHEAGHLIGYLSDEYLGGKKISPPINVTTDLNKIPWSVWLDAGVQIPTPDSYGKSYPYVFTHVGAFQGAYTATAYRPTFASIMGSGSDGGGEYGPVNSEALVLAIYATTGPMLSVTPAAGTVQIGTGQQQSFTPVTWSAPSTIGTAWYVDGNFYASTATLTLHYSDLSVGTHTLKCVIHDSTPFVRSDPNKLLTDTTTWTVVMGDAPVITGQPTSQSVMAGQSASFSVAALGSNLSYQWRKGGQTIAGATGSTYSIASTQNSDSGSYDCVVSNSSGSVTSNAATLTVTGGSSSSGGSGSSGGGACGGWYLLALVGCACLRFGIARKISIMN